MLGQLVWSKYCFLGYTYRYPEDRARNFRM